MQNPDQSSLNIFVRGTCATTSGLGESDVLCVPVTQTVLHSSSTLYLTNSCEGIRGVRLWSAFEHPNKLPGSSTDKHWPVQEV